MTVELELQIASNTKTLPHPVQFKEWIKVIFSYYTKFKILKNLHNTEITIRIVDQAEMADLNKRYRNKDGSTNVLSFAGYIDQQFNYNVLGDLIICAEVVEQEALQQNKELLAHWAHMVVHGILHLLGYDHEDLKDAEQMENLEIFLMQKLGFRDPY